MKEQVASDNLPPRLVQAWLGLIFTLALPALIYSITAVANSFNPVILFLALATAVSSVFPVRLPTVRGDNSAIKVTASDLLIFLSILMVSPETATVLAALDCLLGTRQVRSPFQRASNLASVTLATFVAGQSFYFLIGLQPPLNSGNLESLWSFILAFTACIALHFFLSSSTVSLAASLSLDQPWSILWKKDFFWSFLINGTGAFSAIVVFLSFEYGGVYSFFLILPVALIMHYSYRINGKRVKSLRASREFLQSTLNSLSAAISILDREGKIIAVNEAWRRSEDSESHGKIFRVGTNYLDSCSNFKEPWSKAGPLIYKAIESVIQGTADSSRCEYFSNDPFNPEFFALTVTRFEDNSRFVVAHENVTELRQAERRIVNLAYYDELTGLPNRVFLAEYLPGVIRLSRKAGNKVALLAIDLTQFERINNTLGHELGDQLLCEISTRLAQKVESFENLPQSISPKQRLETASDLDTIVRFGGDEFLVVLASESTSMIEQSVRSLIEILVEPFRISEHEIFLGSNIGVSICPDDSHSAETMIRHADSALYHAKQKGRNQYSLFSQTIASNSAALFKMEHRIRKALEEELFVLHYQPKFEIETGRMLGVEALIRMTDEQDRLTPPSDFIPIAEETGLILPMTKWALRQACLQNQQWCKEYSAEIKVAVNLSSRDLIDQGGPSELVQNVLEETNMDPRFLELEITESTLLDDLDSGVETLKHLRDLGVSIALDDFGTGYSSLNYLARLHIDTIKIDRSFLKEIHNRQNLAIIRAIAAVARSLDLRLVAEGVETESQLELVKMLGCQEVQGFLCSPPVEPERIIRFLRHQQSGVVPFPRVSSGW